MSDSTDSTTSRARALRNCVESLDVTKSLPRHVFKGHWDGYFFFNATHVITMYGPPALSALRSIERASVISVVDVAAILREGERWDRDHVRPLYFDKQTTTEYFTQLREKWPAYSIGILAFASDEGKSCLFADFDADVGVCAYRDLTCVELSQAMTALNGGTLKELCDSPELRQDPFCYPTFLWRQALEENYEARMR